MASYYAVDTDQPVTLAVAQGWQRAHVQGVGRYLPTLRLCEVETLHHAGLKLWSIYETNPTSDAYFTEAQGTLDAHAAIAQAQGVGMPHGLPIFFTVDYVPDAAHAPAIIAYFQALGAAMIAAGDLYTVGAYGNCDVCWWLWNTAGLNRTLRYWQTAGNGACGNLFPFADVIQIPSTCGNVPTLCGCPIDSNVLIDPIGLW